MGSHTSRAYEAELQELKSRLLVMGGRCETLIRVASRAVSELDAELAAEVEASDRTLNIEEIAIDRLTLDILATRQPVGRDLRFLVTSLKVVTDLERIGDEVVNMAERVGELSGHARHVAPLLPAIVHMADTAATLVHRSLDAFVAEDSELARTVLREDDTVDALYGELLRAAIEHMKGGPEHVDDGMRIASCAKYIERIADHATNIAEMVIFMASGEDVRHYQAKQAEQAAAEDPATRARPSRNGV